MIIFNISIISDTVCPWCYIGSRPLQKAIQLFQNTYFGGSKDTFNIEWKPYFLDANASTEGILSQEKMEGRMGVERTAKAQAHMTSLGNAEGITIKYGGRTGNTMLSYQLLHLARSKGLDVQNAVSEELFRLHFSEKRDITDMETMVEASRNVGLDVDEVREYLLRGCGVAESESEAADIRATGVKGVPIFMFGDGQQQTSVDGSGDVMEFFELLMKIK